MQSIFDFEDYRQFLKTWVDSQSGRGASSRLAEAVSVSPSMMSLILKGEKNLSHEQAADLVEFLSLNELESDYFFVLLELGRAGSHKLIQRLQRKKTSLLQQARKVSTRVRKDMELTEEQKSIYYSSWLYTGIRNLSACPGSHDVRTLSERLQIPAEAIQTVVEFLVENGLCKLEKGQLTYGPQYTHLGTESSYVNAYHRAWRMKGGERMEARREQDLYYTCPMSLSHEAFDQVRKLLPTVIQQVLKIGGPSPSEKVACFNIDWFEW